MVCEDCRNPQEIYNEIVGGEIQMVDTKEFFRQMENKIKEHQPIYGNSWKVQPIEYLRGRLRHKIDEYELTNNPSKLISVANLAMLIYLRMKGR